MCSMTANHSNDSAHRRKNTTMNFIHNPTTIGSMLALMASLVCGNSLSATSFSYKSLPGSTISFNGHGNFTFSPSSVGSDNFKITTPGAALNLLGDTTGTFTIGSITTSGGTSTATVTGTGQFIVYDGTGHTLTANLQWDNITQFGTGDTLDDTGTVDLTSISYSGSNSVLLGLARADKGIDSLTFSFTPARTLAYLDTHAVTDSFSGSVNYTLPVPDEGTAALLVLMGCVGIAIGVLAKSRKLANNI